MPNLGDIMTANPTACTPDATATQAARTMRDHDCGIVPVVEDPGTMRLVGVVTDRDIAVRLAAEGRDPAVASVQECWTQQVASLPITAGIDECRRLMEARQVRRVPIVDEQGALVGIVSMADLAQEVSDQALGITLAEVSEPDRRQLYGEVNETSQTGNTVTWVDDPVAQRAIIPPS